MSALLGFGIHFSDNQEFDDVYEEIQLKWKFNSISQESNHTTSLAYIQEKALL